MTKEKVYITKEEADEIMKQKGEVRGGALREDAIYIEKTMGEEVGKKFKEAAKSLPYPIDYDSIKELGWYPAGIRIESLIFLKKYFNWTDKDIRDEGYAIPKISPFMKFFVSIIGNVEKALKQAPDVWSDYWSEGDLSGTLEAPKKAVIDLKNFNMPEILAANLEGYMERLFQFLYKTAKCKIQRVESGSEFPIWRFTVTW